MFSSVSTVKFEHFSAHWERTPDISKRLLERTLPWRSPLFRYNPITYIRFILRRMIFRS